MTELTRVLSFGAGVQSTALLLMSIRGELPMLDYAIFADVGWEPKEVYEHLEWCEEQAAAAGIQLVRVSHRKGKLRETTIASLHDPDIRVASIPFFIRQADGSIGMVRRQCTREYKVEPIERYMRREIIGLKHRQRAPKEVKIEQWMGISFDEVIRAKPSQVPWKVHAFPFVGIECDYLDKVWRRIDCIRWLEKHYPERTIPRSACIGCPYHSNEEWRRIKDSPDEWADAVEFDRACRRPGRGMEGEQYLHRSCIPLDQVDLRTDAEKGQPDLWGNECEGMCGM